MENHLPHAKILLLDTSFAAVPIHDYLSSIGFEVWTIGKRPFDPLALSFPDKWINLDYSKIGAVQAVVDDMSFDFAVPGCTDVSMNTYVHLSYNVPSPFTADVDAILNKKNLFRELCATLDLPAPRACAFEDLPDAGKFLCKPVDSFSGKGITIFDASNKKEAARAFQMAQQHSPSKNVVCENFIEGQLYSYSAFVTNRSVEKSFVVKEGSRYDPFSVDTSHIADWADSSPRSETLRLSIEKLARHLELCDGLLHTQFIADETDLAILEMTRRCPGDLYSMLIEFSTGYPYAAKYASSFVGRSVTDYREHKRFILRHTIKQEGPACFVGFDLERFNANVTRAIPVVKLGDPIVGPGSMRTGLIFLEEPNAAKLGALFELLTTETL